MEKEEEGINPPSLRKIFGESSAMARILDFLAVNRRLDYSKTEIARYAGVGWKTIFRLWPTLERYGLVKLTRKIGRAQLYRLNMENPIARTLDQLALQIAKYDNEKIIKAQLSEQAIEVQA